MSYNTQAFNEFVDNVERTVIQQLMDAKPDMARSLFTSVPWNEGDGDKVTFNSIALSGFAPRVAENDDYSVVNPSKGNELSRTQQQYGDKLEITRRMKKFNTRYAEAKMKARSAKIINRLMNELDLELTLQGFVEADASTVQFNGQNFTSNIETSDSQPVADTAHVYGGVTFSNILGDNAHGSGAALSILNLAAAEEQMSENTPDDFGTYLSPSPDTIVIHDNPYMVQKAHQMFNSSLSPESSNNAVSYYGGPGQYQVVALKYGNRSPLGAVIPTTNAAHTTYRWLIKDKAMAEEAWQLMMAEDPTTEQQFVNEDNLLVKILATQFAAFAIVQPQGTLYSLSTTKPTLT